jgi:NodT family efflux transporter outer membrane factor (OMF) lipoprotein
VNAAHPSTLTPQELDRWWLLFNDPTLDRLEAEAFSDSPDIRTVEARVLEARATRAAQIAQTFPTGGLSGAASHQRSYIAGQNASDLSTVGGVTDTVTANTNVSWEIDLFGRLAAQRRVARATAEEARFNIEGLRATLAADVADAYFQARGYSAQLEDAQNTVGIQSHLLEIAEKRASAGAGPNDEIDRVASQLSQAQAQAADLQAKLDDQRRLLLILVGRNLKDLETLDLDVAAPATPPTPSALPSDLLARRPDVREAEYRLRAQLGTATLADRAIFPTFTLLPGLGLSSTAAPGVSYIPPSTLVTTQQVLTTGFWTLGGGVSTPLLDIPKLLDQAHAEDARTKEAAIAYEKTVRTAFGEAQNALADLAAADKATHLLTAGEAQARRAYDASRRRYAEGLDDLTATLTAEQAWRQIRYALTAERVLTFRRAVETYKALGGGWDAPQGGVG